MVKLRIQRLGELSAEERKTILERSDQGTEAIVPTVREIMENVLVHGDGALRRLTERFDRATLTDIAVSGAEFEAAYEAVDDELVESLRHAVRNLEAFHLSQCADEPMVTIEEGIRVGRVARPIETVGIYVPGGKYPYSSSVLMNGVPSRIAGCAQRIICVPPNREGRVAPALLVAADLVGIRTVFKVGGAQAIAAMAYGTETVPKVDKIFGAGNAYVTAAKMLAFGEVDIDMPAGPTEILIIADETANPRFIAADILSQAEHGETSPCLLVTTSGVLAETVVQEIERQMADLPTLSVAEVALKEHGAILLTDQLEECIAFANRYAPEHLQIMTADNWSVLDLISHAGSVFLGSYAAQSAGDYATGGNHVLPTGGYARMFSALSVDAFTRRMQVQELTREGLYKIKDTVMRMAAAEGLVAHERAIGIRFENDERLTKEMPGASTDS